MINRNLLVFVFFLIGSIAPLRADTVRTLDGKVVRGTAQIDASGALSVKPSPGQAGQPVAIAFSDLLLLRLDHKTGAGQMEGWIGADIGQVGTPGSQKWSAGQVTVEAAGRGFEGPEDSFRMAYQGLSGDGDITARLTAGGLAPGLSEAGVVVRSNGESKSTGADLLMGHDGTLKLVARTSPDGDSQVVKTFSVEHAPIWLRLVIKGNIITAYKSADGKFWNRLGDTNVHLTTDKIAGFAVASHDPTSVCSATFDKPRVYVDHPRGMIVTDLADLKPIIARVHREPVQRDDYPHYTSINGNVIDRSVPPGGTCEARYRLDGKYAVLAGFTDVTDQKKVGGTAMFQVFADNEKLYESAASAAGQPSGYIQVDVTGKKELRLVVTHLTAQYYSADFRSMRLQPINTARAIIRTQMASIQTTGGSVYSNVEIRSLNKDIVEFARGERLDLSLPTDHIARVFMPGLTAQMIDQMPAASTGVLMGSGDFYEGDIDQIKDGKIRVNSVIFGPREFSLHGELLAVALHPAPASLPVSQYVVRGEDGSVLLTDSLAAEAGKLAVTDASIGKLLLDWSDVHEARYTGDRLKALFDVRPRRIDSGDGMAANNFMIDATPLGSDLNLVGTEIDHGISLTTGTSVTYDLNNQYKTFLCAAGIPAEVLPVGTAVFVVQADGKELFRSPPRTSVQDALPISVDTTGLKSITVHVELAKGTAIPVIGLFADPLLVKNPR